MSDTARSVPEWIGTTPDTPVPPRVRLRVFERAKSRCHKCRRKIRAGDSWTCEHMTALINWSGEGHGNRESNLDVTCEWCLPAKNAADVAEKSRTARVKKKHLGLTKPKRQPSPMKRKMDGTVVWRATGEPVNG